MDSFTLWQNASANNPLLDYAHNSLGAEYFKQGDYGLAKYEYETALEMNPNNYSARYNLAYYNYAVKNDKTAAASELQKANSLRPSYIPEFRLP